MSLLLISCLAMEPNSKELIVSAASVLPIEQNKQGTSFKHTSIVVYLSNNHMASIICELRICEFSVGICGN